MASLIAPAVGAISKLLAAPGLVGALGRGAVSGIGAVGAAELLKAIQDDLSHPDPAVKATARRLPQYAIVDLHSNKVVRTLSARHVYSILTHPRRKTSRARKVEFIQVPSGTTIERVR